MKQFIFLAVVLFTFFVAPDVFAGVCSYPGTQGKVSSYYDGRLIDTHLHIPSPEDSDNGNPVLNKDMTMDDIACTLQYEDTDYAFSFFPVYINSTPHTDFYNAARIAKNKYPKKFFRFINPPGGTSGVPTVTAKELRTLLKESNAVSARLFEGYGEIGLYGSDAEVVNPYKPYAKIFRKIYSTVERRNFLVYYHPGVNQSASLERVLDRYPNMRVIVHGEQIEDEIGDIMTKYPNVYFTVNDLYGDQYLLHQNETKEGFLEKTEDYNALLALDVARWKELIEAHPHQFLWGTDRGGVAAWTLDPEVGLRLADYGRAFIATLEPEVQENFAYKNALRLVKSARR